MSEPIADSLIDIAPVPLKEDLKLAGFLGVLAALATAALFPYLLVVMPQLLAKIPHWLPLPALIVLQSLQAALLLTLLSFLGLCMGHRVGLDAPWLRALLFRRPRPRLHWQMAMAFGLFAGLLMIGLDPLFAPHMPAPLHPQAAVAAQASAAVGFLASFYGGIGEELQLRLFMMTLLVWALSLFTRNRPRAGIFWIAIVAAALLFGAGHLPAAAQMWPLDAVVVTRIIVLNSLGGLVFGWLYWKHGLESAMLAHFSADLVLHVLAPLAFG
ncbi:MAG TPA: CPBP family intramembrane glutamic endopeptidase [Arenimonas sp.]|uniref:CPBP family intramembrane glutamic endopeptidase n=1 Tax=Arenimonas sp. TaxID=1872635 RepID=UPI002BECA1D4|nr:CPBP family intramembrane glutamic endopeptidase [Arenimonas sp.]HMB57386.1 CPBP family intramembrane glutamic endopeptidase [Arenimonas sp.]